MCTRVGRSIDPFLVIFSFLFILSFFFLIFIIHHTHITVTEEKQHPCVFHHPYRPAISVARADTEMKAEKKTTDVVSTPRLSSFFFSSSLKQIPNRIVNIFFLRAKFYFLSQKKIYKLFYFFLKRGFQKKISGMWLASNLYTRRWKASERKLFYIIHVYYRFLVFFLNGLVVC